MRIVVADTDPSLAQGVPPLLRREGHRVYVCPSLGDLPELVPAQGIDLVIMEPALDPLNLSIDLCRTLRRDSAVMLFLVSRVTAADERVRALIAGADDYLTKPFDRDELLARVIALLRRHPLHLSGDDSGMVRVTDNWWLNIGGRRLTNGTRQVDLTEREFRLLVHLMRREGVPVSREALLDAVWGQGYEGLTREVDVYIRYLRRKLEPNRTSPQYILTVWGRGYMYRRLVSEADEHVEDFQQNLSRAHSRIVGDL